MSTPLVISRMRHLQTFWRNTHHWCKNKTKLSPFNDVVINKLYQNMFYEMHSRDYMTKSKNLCIATQKWYSRHKQLTWFTYLDLKLLEDQHHSSPCCLHILCKLHIHYRRPAFRRLWSNVNLQNKEVRLHFRTSSRLSVGAMHQQQHPLLDDHTIKKRHYQSIKYHTHIIGWSITLKCEKNSAWHVKMCATAMK
jgi:hypothetical protein